MTTRRRTLGLASVLAFGCTTLPDKNLGEIGDTTGEGDDAQSSTDDGATGQSEGTAGSETGEGDPIGCVPDDVDPPECHEDPEKDTIRVGCDNAPDHFNPSQSDMDEDGVGDVADLCPAVASDSNTADSDRDGIGNDCDLCGRTLAEYNAHDAGIAVSDYMFVRNVPWQGDADQDGVGDVCDNCVRLANCEGEACQRDDDADLVGDACAGDMAADAAGPVGLAAQDDFDQDGITNVLDACPRQPLPERIACTGPSDCPEFSACDDEVCDHVDMDDDGVGDICDSCRLVGNPQQTMDGAAQEEDEDGDFVADVCETHVACATIGDPRPTSFHAVSVNGECCTVALLEVEGGALVNGSTQQPLFDPDGVPLLHGCSDAQEDAGECRQLPLSVDLTPGILHLPPGCNDALALAGITVEENGPLTLADVDGDVEVLMALQCKLPQWDQDFDGLGDACDLCPFMFDPDNQVYVDEQGTAWPEAGKYCNGDYSPDAICQAESG